MVTGFVVAVVTKPDLTSLGPHKKVNVGIIVQLSKDLMDWVSRKLCYAVGNTDRAVSYVGPWFIVSSETLGEWSLYTS